jgi:hypothetical protein
MAVRGEWVDYDSADINTYPEEASEIEMAFRNGSRVRGIFSRAAGIVSHPAFLPPEKIKLQKRWRYINPAAN